MKMMTNMVEDLKDGRGSRAGVGSEDCVVNEVEVMRRLLDNGLVDVDGLGSPM